jgi:hypothetical protein
MNFFLTLSIFLFNVGTLSYTHVRQWVYLSLRPCAVKFSFIPLRPAQPPPHGGAALPDKSSKNWRRKKGEMKRGSVIYTVKLWNCFYCCNICPLKVWILPVSFIFLNKICSGAHSDPKFGRRRRGVSCKDARDTVLTCVFLERRTCAFRHRNTPDSVTHFIVVIYLSIPGIF